MRRPVILLFFLLGAWCAATVFMWQTAIQNFAVAASVQASGEAGLREAVGDLTDEDLRLVLRHQASETNRLFFRSWGWIQIPLATAVLFLAWKFAGGRLVTAASAATLGIALLLSAYVVPETVRLGRMLDFAGPGALAEVRSAFWFLHNAYTGLDMVKLLLCLGIVGAVCVRTAGARPPA